MAMTLKPFGAMALALGVVGAGLPIGHVRAGEEAHPVSGAKASENIEITPPSAPVKGAVENFSGDVEVASRFQAPSPSRAGGGIVSFAPGARTAWHSHPLGQTLIVTQGQGLVQEWGGRARVIRPGEVVWTPPNVRHWHGAMPAQGMTHVAISERSDEGSAVWGQKVSDAEYRAAVRAANGNEAQ